MSEATDRNWSIRRSIITLSMVGVSLWCLVAGIIWVACKH